MKNKLFKKLLRLHILKRIYLERLGEPFIYNIDHNDYCGELLAISEFNCQNTLRKISKATMLTQTRIFRRSPWSHQIYLAHIFDHKNR